ncbi:hypothetical protein BDB00DRAFT_788193 [Zychaea mexicana]|uniref:uncharacterized protein n=1 Tax=Zychaea mexicana TaxID=64656 RepID=UPI0022FE256C|nr:uncharacterized protein BDB00DRAFT_788193 [Zychaea mexicana]KAI9493140.1 hypothetical protein BDB00DRAFT_788193 [Zychaea mexicana]
MPSESQNDEICVVPSNSTCRSSDMLSAAFQKQATVVDGTNCNRQHQQEQQEQQRQPATQQQQRPNSRKQQQHDPALLRPSQLATMLKDDTAITSSNSDQPLLIDVRDYEHYEKARIRNSINVNLPTLLIKRYRRGTVSNFNLESFISTEEGKQYYLSWLRKPSTNLNQQQRRIVVYDDTMNDLDSHAWILVAVLKARQKQQLHHFNICTMDGGFDAFARWDAWGAYLVGSVHDNLLAPNASSSSSWAPWDGPQPAAVAESGTSPSPSSSSIAATLGVPATPTQSRSATTFSSGSSAWINPIDTNVQRRASLFSLDTSSARSKFHSNRQRNNNKDHLHIKPSRSSRGFMKPNGSSTTATTTLQNNDNDNDDRQQQRDLASISEATSSSTKETPLQQQQLPATPSTPVTTTSTTSTVAAPDSNVWSADGTSEGNHAFIISEIVPGFLYLGPEISTQEQVVNLHTRSIKQILNMAEECNDDVPGLKDRIKYHKVAAQDTVIMQNVEETLKQAVQVIDQAKQIHEPIYVHCKAGKSRSVAAILAYFVVSERWTLKRAYKHVIKARPSMSPNIGFVAELLKLEECVHGQVSNFGAPNWQSVDPSIPPSPESQQALGKVKMAWSSAAS